MKRLTVATVFFVSGSAFAGSGVVGNIGDVSAPSGDAAGGWKVQLGVGAINAQTFPGVDDTETNGVPLINVSYNDTFYFEFNKLGAWLWKPENTGFRIGLVATPRKGYDKGDGPNPLLEVDDTALAGIRAKWKSGMFSLNASLLGSSEDDSGGEARLQANYTFIANKTGSLTGFAKVEALSEDAVDYFYYANSDTGDSSTIASLGLLGTYKVAAQWTVMGAVMASSYGDEISDAPGVTEDSGTTALIGLTYTF